MPCGFNGDSVDFDSVVVETEFCAGDWALGPSSPCSATVLGSLDNLNGNFGYGAAAATPTGDPHAPTPLSTCPTPNSGALHPSNNNNSHHHQGCQPNNSTNRKCNNNLEIEDSESALVTDDLKNRLLVKYEDECTKMDTDEFDLKQQQQGKQERKGDSGATVCGGGQDDEDEIFFQPPRRISMLWNSKLRWKEERKKVLKISINKLRRIEDPELFLCRSVLINNTVRRLHREIREEKMARYPEIHRPIPTTVTSSCSLGHHGNGIPEPFPRKRSSSLSSLSVVDSNKENGGCCSLKEQVDRPSSQTVFGKESCGRLEVCPASETKDQVSNGPADDGVPAAKRLRIVPSMDTSPGNGFESCPAANPTSPACSTTGPLCTSKQCCDEGAQSGIGSIPPITLDNGGETYGLAQAPGGGQHCKLSSCALGGGSPSGPYSRHQQGSVFVGTSSSGLHHPCMVHHPNYGQCPPSADCSHQSSPCAPMTSSQRANGGCCGTAAAAIAKAKCDHSPFRPALMTVECPRQDGGRLVTASSDHLVLTSTCAGGPTVAAPPAGPPGGGVQLVANKDRRTVVSEYEKQYSQYSCGQLSIFGELQSVVFHSLIASLES